MDRARKKTTLHVRIEERLRLYARCWAFSGTGLILCTLLAASGDAQRAVAAPGDPQGATPVARATPASASAKTDGRTGIDAVPPRFLTTAQFPLGAIPVDFAVGHYDTDGFLDVATVNAEYGEKSLTVLLGDGQGGFAPPVVSELIVTPSDVASADFDEDGLQDLVVSGSQIAVLMADRRHGGFDQSVVAEDEMAYVATADFNLDGHADFASAYSVDSPLAIHTKIYFGRGNGEFDPPAHYETPGDWHDVSELLAADLDSDGDTDLLRHDTSPVSVRLNQGDGTLGPETSTYGTGGVRVALADFDGDGLLDAAGTWGSGGRVEIALGDGRGEFTFLREYVVARTQAYYVTAGDVNGDGKADLVVGDDTDVFVIMHGRGDGSFDIEGSYLSGAFDLALADIDGDGIVDVLGVFLGQREELSVAYATGRSRRAYAAAVAYSFAEWHDVLELGDVNGDGRLDVVGDGYFAGRIEVLPNQGNRRLGVPIVSPSGAAQALAFGDLDGDNALDAVIGMVPISDVPNLEIHLGNGNGRFSYLARINNGSGAAVYDEALALGDMNGDAALDIVSNTFTAISVLPGRGDGTFDPAVISGAGSGASEVVLLRDFNKDNRLDVVSIVDTGSYDHASSTVYLNLGNGDGSLRFVQSFTVGARNPSGDSADLNRDGLPDIVLAGHPGAHTGPGGMFVAMNTGGSFGAPVRYDAATGGVALGDLNGDKRVDAVTNGLNSVQVWTNLGNGRFGPTPFDLATPAALYEVEVGDLFGSPRPDIVLLDSYITPSTAFVYQNLTR